MDISDPLSAFLESFGSSLGDELRQATASAAAAAASAEDTDWSKKKLYEIKDELKKRGLKVTGNKAELVARLNGLEIPPSTPKKRKVGDSADAPKTKKSKDEDGLIGFPIQDSATKLKTLKKELLKYVKTVAKMVNRDWHDGWEEQGEQLNSYTNSLALPLQAIYDLAVINQRGFDRCHNVLLIIADSWENMKAIPMRGGIEENTPMDITIRIDEARNIKLTSMPQAINTMWGRILLAAARNANVDDEKLKRFIKDASDYSCTIIPDEVEESPETIEHNLLEGKERLERLFDERQWLLLPSVKRTYKMRNGIDRRFSGPKHLRTRDYGSDNDNEEGCSLM